MLLQPYSSSVLYRAGGYCCNHPLHSLALAPSLLLVRHRRRSMSFSFAGPRKLEDLLKKDRLEGKSADEITDIWRTYHQDKVGSLGLVLPGKKGRSVLERAKKCPFFVQPVFRDDGFFMLLSQFQSPTHFLLAYLEDYKMDPSAATPLLTMSVFDDYDTISLIRADVLNKSITEEEKIVRNILRNYQEEFETIKIFNQRPDRFDFDGFINRMKDRWQKES